MFDFYYDLMKDEHPENFSKVRRIVECGLQATLMVVLALVGSTVPIFGILAFMCYPAPILFLTVRLGLREAFLSGLVALLLISIFLNPFTAARIFIMGVPLGMLLGYGFNKQWSYFKLISLGSVVASLLLILVMVGLTMLLGDVLIPNFTFFPSYDSIHLSGVDMSSPEAVQAVLAEFLFLTWPTILFVGGLMMVVPSVIWSSRLLKRFGVEVPPLSGFSDFRLPKFFTLAFLLSIIAMGIGFGIESGPLLQLGFNLHLICSLFGFVSGTALYCHFTKLYNWHIAFRIIVFGVIISITVLGECLTWIGLFDPLVNLRERFKRKESVA